VLGHLGEVERWLSVWASQLAPVGLLALEENEWIDARNPAFARYLELAERALAAHGAVLHPGARVAAAAASLGLAPAVNRVTEISPPTATAARMFGLNLRSWSASPVAGASEEELASLGAELAEMESSSAEGEITWGLRQMAARSGRMG
jgi:hypothetical protein